MLRAVSVSLLHLTCLVFWLMEQVRATAEKPIVYFERLLPNEVQKIDLLKYGNRIRDIEIVQNNEGMASAEQISIARSTWLHQQAFPFSDLTTECLNLGSRPPKTVRTNPQLFNDSAWVKSTTVITRNVKTVDRHLYISTSYQPNPPILDKDKRSLLVLETLRIPYNATAFGNVTELQYETYPNAKPDHWETRVHYQYIKEFDEYIYLSVRTRMRGSPQAPVFDIEILIARKESLVRILNYTNSRFMIDRSVVMFVNPTIDRKMEIMVYVLNQRQIAVFTIDPVQTSRVNIFEFSTEINKLDYIAGTLLIFNSKISGELKTYYLERSPGATFDLENAMLFADSIYLSSTYSTETLEINIETIKMSQFTINQGTKKTIRPGYVAPILYNLYSFNLITKRMAHRSSQIFALALTPDRIGAIFRVDPLPMLDNVALLLNIRTLYFANAIEDRFGYNMFMDAYTGFGSTTLFNPNYHFYSTMNFNDGMTGQHIFLLFMARTRVGRNVRMCHVLKQRIVRPYLRMQQKQSLKMVKSLNLDFRDKRYNTTVFKYNISFVDSQNRQMVDIYKDLWRGSTYSEYQIRAANSRRRAIELDKLVRGSFIRREEPGVPFALDYAKSNTTLINNAVKIQFFDTLSIRDKSTSDLRIDEVDFMLAIERILDDKKVETVIFAKSVHDPKISKYSIVDGQMKEKGFHELGNESILKVFSLDHNLYLFFTVYGEPTVLRRQHRHRQAAQVPRTRLPRYRHVESQEVEVLLHLHQFQQQVRDPPNRRAARAVSLQHGHLG
jgi:hypothetical protein